MSLPKQIVNLERVAPFADRSIGRIEGECEIWRESDVPEIKFRLRVTTRLLPAAGTELTVQGLYHGRIQGEKAEFISVDGEPFESPYIMMVNEKLRLTVPYRTSRTKGVAYFFGGPGAETMHTETLDFQFPKEFLD